MRGYRRAQPAGRSWIQIVLVSVYWSWAWTRLVVAAEARQLVAAERRRHVALGVGVDRRRRRPCSSRATRCATLRSSVYSEAARPYGVSFAMRDRLGLGLELDHRQDRPEDLLARDRHVVADVVEDRRRDEPAAGLLEDPLAAGRRPARPRSGRRRRSRARAPCGRAMISAPIRVAGSSGSPTGQLSSSARTASRARSLTRAVDDQPRPGRAVLAHVPEDRDRDVRGDVREVGRRRRTRAAGSCRRARAARA